nr:type I polyketide synthase [Geoanaerobacter pelophilus]
MAIVGIGCLFPKAEDQTTYWANIREGIDAITDIPSTHWRVEDYYSPDQKTPDFTYGKRGGFLSPLQFNPLEFNIPPNTLEAIDTSQLLGLVAAGQALKDAGYGPDRQYDRNRVSVILGVTGTLELVIPLGARLGHPLWKKALKEAGVEDAVAEDVVQRISDSYVPWQENSFPGLLGNVVAGRISKQYDLGGTNCVVDAACASSFSALHLASMELATGKSDMVVTGGIDTFNDIFMYMCFSKTPALSPTGNAKPFDASGDGTILGEGLGIVVIKRLADAERDGDRIYAVIKGIGSSSDGKGDAIYAPSAGGQKKALKNAYENAGVTPQSIGLLEAHGTGTKVGDGVEVSALREIYGDSDQPWCALGSVKSQIGHTKAAAGAAGLIKAALALHHKVIPPTIKVTNPLEEVTGGKTPFYLNAEKRPWLSPKGVPRRAAVSAFGFGGSNFHTVLEEYLPEKTAIDWDGSVQILAFAASNRSELEEVLSEFPTDLTWDELRTRGAKLRLEFEPSAPCRLALVVEKDRTSLTTMFANTQAMLRSNQAAAWQTPDGACFSSAAAGGKTGVVFPGQGSQYLGMQRDLACSFPELFSVIAAADERFTARGTSRLSDFIYPLQSFGADTRDRQESELRATDVAQPAIGAVSLGSMRLLETFGIEPDAVAGHSYGELTALCVAGVLDEPSFHALSGLRGALMARGDGDRGSMLAVPAPLPVIEGIIAEEHLELVIANRNSPTQAVLSGSSAEIDRACAAFAARKLQTKKLPVAAAFHSPLVADAAEPFLEALSAIDLNPARIAVYANTSGDIYPSAPAEAKTLLANQLAKPVEFVAEIEAMYSAGIRTFIEVGPGTRLTGLIKAILGDREHVSVALDSSNGKRTGIADLARLLAQLAVYGHQLKLTAWDADYRPPATASGKKPAMTVPICGANYVKPKAKRPPVAPRTFAQGHTAPAVPNSAAQQPIVPAPSPQAPRESVAESLRVARESMAVLQKMQEDTARLHQRFLEGQEAASRTLQMLLAQQHNLLNSGSVPYVAPAAPPSFALPEPPVMPPVQPAPIAITPAQPLPVPTVGATDQVSKTLLAVVSEKTGYPEEMLEMEMGLDSDLGIDSIKRVEILSALQERLPGAPVIGPEHLGTLHTLGEIARHLGAGEASAAPVVQAAPAASANNITETLLTVVSEKTGYPVEMLELGMGLDSDLGIDSIKRVEILSTLQERLPGAPVIGPEHLGTLHTLGEIATHLGSGAPTNIVTAPSPAPTPSSTVVTDALLAVVSDKTGYPVEMLELGMGLDSDLGIDSIKRVEILSALQERLPQAPVIGPEHLGTLHTLGEIANFLGAGTVSVAPAPEAAAAVSAPTASVDIAGTLLSVVSDKTGYPVEMLELGMGLDSDLGIDSIKRVEILSTLQERLPEAPVIGPEHLGTLHTLGEIVQHLQGGLAVNQDAPAAAPKPVNSLPSAAATAATVVNRSAIVPVQLQPASEKLEVAPGGEFWITDNGSQFPRELASNLRSRGHAVRMIAPGDSIDNLPDSELSGLVVCAPSTGTSDSFIEESFLLLRKASLSLRRAGSSGGAIFVTVSRLDGKFGCGAGTTLIDPLSGGLAGLSKTASREWPEVSCKAIDLGSFSNEAAAAGAVAEEIFSSGPVEVGLTPKGRTSLSLAELPQLPPAEGATLNQGEVVIVTGGGRGVTAATAIALAEAFRPHLVLLGRSPEPSIEPEWLSQLGDEAGIKRAILKHAGEKLFPKEVEERYRSIIAGRELKETIARIEASGATVSYRSLDIRDKKEITPLLDEIRRKHGRIRGIVHGAGVLADRLITDKTREQFSQVYSTKVAGLRALLDATAKDDLRFIALFGSTTGRFGRTGQVDYAVANEVLNKLAQVEARRRPGCRTVCINWGPWDGGMVTNSLKKVFSDEGIALIGLKEGSELLIREIAAADAPVEVVALAGGKTVPQAKPASPRVKPLSEALAITLNVNNYPFLKSHVIDGKAVLPMAVIVEWLAHGALHSNPGLRFHGFNDLRIFKGVIFDGSAPCNLRILAGKVEKKESFHLVPIELHSSSANGQDQLHVRTEIVLATRLPEGIRSIAELPATPFVPHNGVIYDKDRLFHGPDLQGIEEVECCSPKGISAMVKGAPQPASWISQPLRNSWLTDPLVMDCAFQMMILWSFDRTGAGSLPTFAGRYRQFSEAFPRDGAHVMIRVTEVHEHSATADIEFLDRQTGKLIARMEGYECVIDPSLQKAFQRNQLHQLGVA